MQEKDAINISAAWTQFYPICSLRLKALNTLKRLGRSQSQSRVYVFVVVPYVYSTCMFSHKSTQFKSICTRKWKTQYPQYCRGLHPLTVCEDFNHSFDYMYLPKSFSFTFMSHIQWVSLSPNLRWTIGCEQSRNVVNTFAVWTFDYFTRANIVWVS